MESTTAATAAPQSARMPIQVTKVDVVFGGMVNKILPPMAEIPEDFKRNRSPWVKWQRDWFYEGLGRWPLARDGIDLNLAMANLACVQGSFAPKHEHKEAGVAYLASLWFSSADGTEVATGSAA